MSAAPGERIFPRWFVALLATLLVGFGLYALRGVLTPVFFAFLIAYLLDPLVDRLERRGIPRSAGIVVLLGSVLGALTVFLLLAVPNIVRDASAFAHELPDRANDAYQGIRPWLAARGLPLPESIHEAVAGLLANAGEATGPDAAEATASGVARGREAATALLDTGALSVVGTALSGIVGGTASAIGAVIGLLMVPIIASYLLHDFDRIIAAIRSLIPWRMRPFVVDVATEIDGVLSQFVRGQVTVMVILAVLYAVAYSLIGVRLAVVIGLVAGLLSFIPYVGGALALGLALLMVFLDFQGWGQVAMVVAAYAAIQVLEGFVITPRIVGDKVGLPAIAVLLALMIGGEIFGFMGVLLAVPAAAVAKIFMTRTVAYYKRSQMFLRGAPTALHADRGSVWAGLLREEGLPDDSRTAARKHGADEGPPASVVADGRSPADREPDEVER